MKRILLPILSLLIFLPNVDARFWTNKDGKEFDLSQEDQEYLKELEEKKKTEEEKKRLKDGLPKTKEELAKWIVGTEWNLKEGKAESKMVRRFLPDGVMLFQSKILKWDKSRAPEIVKYRILSENSIVYGTAGWTIVFDKKLKTFKGKASNGTMSCTGKLVDRFLKL